MNYQEFISTIVQILYTCPCRFCIPLCSFSIPSCRFGIPPYIY
nr:MAG TPA: hypothetical protein [Caudoviricetes sp.]